MKLKQWKPCLIALAMLLCGECPAVSALTDTAVFLPLPACGEGWHMDGKVTLYNRETLSDRINGESELYFPYGFDQLGYARYVQQKQPGNSFDADIYRMGSLLDAFGMFANYRSSSDAVAAVGAAGSVSPSQLFFYQERYFIRLQSTGSTPAGEAALLNCARAIAKKLPGSSARPAELDAFTLPDVDTLSIRYLASSLLGYDFFSRGFMADASVNGQQLQLFLVPEQSQAAARSTFDRYRDYLKSSGKNLVVTETAQRKTLKALDPLYGPVVAELSGRFVLGAVRTDASDAVFALFERVKKNLK